MKGIGIFIPLAWLLLLSPPLGAQEAVPPTGPEGAPVESAEEAPAVTEPVEPPDEAPTPEPPPEDVVAPEAPTGEPPEATGPTAPPTDTAPPAADLAPVAGTPTAPAPQRPTESLPADQSPPQILSPDLLPKQWITEPVRRVNFVLLDQSQITEVTLNGVQQPITPANTIALTKKFRFGPGKTLITLEAQDAAGNRSRRSFLIGFAPERVKGPKAAAGSGLKLRWIVGVDYELDSNPTLDLSSPIAVGDLEIKGVVDDAEQADYRTQLKGILAAQKGSLSGLLGVVRSTYDKPENEPLNSQVTLAGAGWKKALGESSFFKLNYLFTDVNVGGYDYSQNHGLSPGLLFTAQAEGEKRQHYLGLDWVQQDFAGATQTDDAQTGVRWDYTSTDAEQDRFKSRLAYGTASEGTEESQQTYTALELDWHNQWEVPFWDLGFSLQHKEFANETPLITDTALGETRVDLPLSFSTALGLKWSQVMVKAHYKYTFNLSNKVIYVRTLTGLAVQGAF